MEPYFSLAYYYKGILGGKQLQYVNKHLRSLGLPEDAIAHIMKTGSLRTCTVLGVPQSLKRVFATAMDIDAQNHILMQATFQKYCTNAISKTINFPNSASTEDIHGGYLMAWRLGCKGVTVYRDGSRDLQVLNVGALEDQEDCGTSTSDSAACCLTPTIIRSGGCMECRSCGWAACTT